jgi:hypothetical protein
MAERMLTLRELNRATLARQMLLERVSLTPLEAVERLIGLQAQVPAPPYVGLWTRLHSFARQDLTQLLHERRVVRATLMRATLHLMSAADYRLFRLALQPALSRAMRAFFGEPARRLALEDVLAAVLPYVQERPRTFVEIRAHLSARFADVDAALLAYVVRTHLPLVQVPDGSRWGFSGSPAFADAVSWLAAELAAPEEGLPVLVRRYLAAFGPASASDLQVWSGLSGLQPLLRELRPEVLVFRDEQGRELFDLPEQPRPPAESAAPPRFLPEYDNLLLSHAQRTRVLPEEYRRAVFLSAGRVQATVLVDGLVAGTWRLVRERAEARLEISLFRPQAAAIRDELAAEGERLVHFLEEGAARYSLRFLSP